MTRCVYILSIAIVAGSFTAAQSPRQFRARLSPVPLDVAMQATIAGSGTITASLSGNTLSITGTYAGLKSPATVVRLHDSAKAGLRGKPIADLKASGGISGTIAGTIELTADQVTALNSARLYVQLHSEKAPDGNLWGWLMVNEGKK